LSSTTPIKDSEPYGLFNGDGKYSRWFWIWYNII
jgi:hypothetical protein